MAARITVTKFNPFRGAGVQTSEPTDHPEQGAFCKLGGATSCCDISWVLSFHSSGWKTRCSFSAGNHQQGNRLRSQGNFSNRWLFCPTTCRLQRSGWVEGGDWIHLPFGYSKMPYRIAFNIVSFLLKHTSELLRLERIFRFRSWLLHF